MAEFARLAAKNVENEFNDSMIMASRNIQVVLFYLRQDCPVSQLNGVRFQLEMTTGHCKYSVPNFSRNDQLIYIKLLKSLLKRGYMFIPIYSMDRSEPDPVAIFPT
ncbi:hypothetical protein KKI24_19245 [bacterium]|nr:hypothetical protein [bacterium]